MQLSWVRLQCGQSVWFSCPTLLWSFWVRSLLSFSMQQWIAVWDNTDALYYILKWLMYIDNIISISAQGLVQMMSDWWQLPLWSKDAGDIALLWGSSKKTEEDFRISVLFHGYSFYFYLDCSLLSSGKRVTQIWQNPLEIFYNCHVNTSLKLLRWLAATEIYLEILFNIYVNTYCGVKSSDWTWRSANLMKMVND